MKREGREGMQRESEEGQRQAGRTGQGAGWPSSRGIVQPAGWPGLCRGTGSGRGGHFCPDTKEEEASSPAPPGRPAGVGTPGLQDIEPYLGPGSYPSSWELSHALIKEQRRQDEGGFKPAGSSFSSSPGDRAHLPLPQSS